MKRTRKQHSAAFNAKVEWRQSGATGPSPSWRCISGYTRTSCLKYEEVYLNAYATVAEAQAGIGCWLDFYNTERQAARKSSSVS